MKSVSKMIQRFIAILFLSMLLLIAMNLIFLSAITSKEAVNSSPWATAEETAQALQKNDNRFTLPENIAKELSEQNIWGIFIDNDTRRVVWNTPNLPKDIPTEYTLSDISRLTRGYIKDYPAFPGNSENGLLVLGYPKDSYWKHMWPSYDYKVIANLPKIILAELIFNIMIIFIIYIVSNYKFLKSIRPVINGIQALPSGEPVYINEKGLLSELASNINATSEVLQSQNYQLRKKETARANWIAGVSHDIRTPLSMVLGYAEQLKDDTNITANQKQQISIIINQSTKIRNLINDLNLASKLEYNMQPVTREKINVISAVRQVAVDFINMDIEEKYALIWQTEKNLNSVNINADKELIKRAVSNLIQNCMNHNENGCMIFITVKKLNDKCIIEIEDDGPGVSEKQIEKLNNTPHYMVCDTNTTEQRHGLGLLIVKQIAASHNGSCEIARGEYGGFCVRMILPSV